jgi:penicillin-binding protein 1A
MALGTASLTPLSMARGYAVFANGGFLVQPQYIRRITNMDGETVYETRPSVPCDDCVRDAEEEVIEVPAQKDEPEFKPLDIESGTSASEPQADEGLLLPERVDAEQAFAERVITPQNAYLVRSMMMDVVRRGTGVRAMELGRNDLAGKTGTTNEQRDAWFSGYNDRLVTSVWVGFDNHDPLGRRELGGRAALPVWVAYMAVALDGVEDKPPAMPDGLARARIDPDTGLLARLEDKDAIMEIFQAGRLPPMPDSGQGENPDAPPEEDPYEIY